MGYGPEFAVVFAAVLALNGQEWYQDRFGTEGRLGTGWTIWSPGGRLVTLWPLFLLRRPGIITGWRKSARAAAVRLRLRSQRLRLRGRRVPGPPRRHQGQRPQHHAAQGDALIWKAYPARRTFFDGRRHLFSRRSAGGAP